MTRIPNNLPEELEIISELDERVKKLEKQVKGMELSINGLNFELEKLREGK